MKKWMVMIMMSLTFLTSAFAQDKNPHVIVQQGANLPITQLTFFVPMGTAVLDQMGGETALLKKVIAQSILGEIIENYGGSYSIDTSSDSFAFQLTLLTEKIEDFLQEFIPALQSFEIKEDLVEVAKQQLMEELQSFNSNPNRRSYALFLEKIFSFTPHSAPHPYGRTKLGTEKFFSLSNTAYKETLKDIWNQLFNNKNSLYLILASAQPEKYQKLLHNIWDSFSDETHSIPEIPAVQFLKKTAQWSVQDTSLSQSFVHVGFLLPPTPLEQEHLMMMFQEIMGGGFNSRLFKILRAQHGLSYSPHAIFSSALKADIFDIFYSTKTLSTKESLNIVYKILDDLKQNGVTQDEFDTTKKLVYNSILRLGEDNASLNQVIANDILYKRKLGSIQILEEQIRNSSVEDLNTFIKNILNTYPNVTFVLGES